MAKDRAVAGITIVMVLLVALSDHALAAPTAALWHMEDPDLMDDSSGNGNDGRARDITGVPGSSGRGYRFNGDTSLVTVPSSSSLNPGSADVRVTVRMRFDEVPGKDYDVIRKGLGDTEGGQYKMQVAPNSTGEIARANCTFHGSAGEAKISSPRNVADGRWHTVSCEKTAGAVRIIVDGEAQTRAATIGVISNSEPLTVGGKPFPEDQFRGDMDEVSVRIG